MSTELDTMQLKIYLFYTTENYRKENKIVVYSFSTLIQTFITSTLCFRISDVSALLSNTSKRGFQSLLCLEVQTLQIISLPLILFFFFFFPCYVYG